MSRISVGVIGTGFSAMSHIEALQRLNNIKVLGVVGSNPEKANDVAEFYHLPKAYGNAAEMINDPEIEAIHNCTPNRLHYSINLEAIRAGKHLLSEKPLAISSAESAKLLDAARQSESQAAVCYNYRFYPMVMQARHMMNDPETGRIFLVHGGYLQDWLLYDTDFNWRLLPEHNGPSRAVADIGSHWCDTVQFILGRKITEVFADLGTVHPYRKRSEGGGQTFEKVEDRKLVDVPVNSEDIANVLVRFEDGVRGMFTVSQVSAGRKNQLIFEISSERTTIHWEQESANRLWIGKRDKSNSELYRDPSLLSPAAAAWAHYPGGHEEGWPDTLKNLFFDFYSQVGSVKAGEKRKEPLFSTLEEAHHIMKINEAIMESHNTGRWVTVS